jgi:hypothetical protein
MNIQTEISHELDCASAAYAALLERAEIRGDRSLAINLRREWREYRCRSLATLHDELQAGEPK